MAEDRDLFLASEGENIVKKKSVNITAPKGKHVYAICNFFLSFFFFLFFFFSFLFLEK